MKRAPISGFEQEQKAKLCDWEKQFIERTRQIPWLFYSHECIKSTDNYD